MSKKLVSTKKTKFIIESSSSEESNSSSSKNSTSSEESGSSNESEEIRELPILYGVDSKGKDRMWKCWTEGNVLHTEAGLVDRKHTFSEHAYQGVNQKNKNANTGEEQAWAVANKRWASKLDKTYLPSEYDDEGQEMLFKINKEKKKTGGHNINSGASVGARKSKNTKRTKKDTCMVEEITCGTYIPMKAEKWELEDENDPDSVKQKVKAHFMKKVGVGKKATWEDQDFYSQPKLDGWRCRVMIQPKTDSNEEWEVLMASNSGKQYPWFNSLRKLFLEWLVTQDSVPEELMDGLDGELYCNQFYDEEGEAIDPLKTFSIISSICGLGRSEPHKYEDQIQFHCFDLMDVQDDKLSQKERFKNLNELFKSLPKSAKKRIIRVPTKLHQSIDEVPDQHNEYVNELGAEGIILRACDTVYKPKSRSLKMRKFKMFDDNEYEIIGAKIDKGTGDQNFSFSWKLQTENGKEFYAVPKGERDQKKKWYKNRDDYVGKFVTLKYQGISDDGIPRFPVVKCFRTAKGTD
jgi:hypothetical protein